MKIAVKYCGGCNPYYDRVAEVEKLRREFPEAEFVGAGEYEGGDLSESAAKPDLVLVVCGCQAACAEHRRLTGINGKIIMAGVGDFAKARERLRAVYNDSGTKL